MSISNPTGPMPLYRVEATTHALAVSSKQHHSIVGQRTTTLAEGHLKTISVLQIGDVHYPDHKEMLLADLKDQDAPALIEGTSPKVLLKVVRAIANRNSMQTFSAVLMCGDLTTAGNCEEYQECVNYLVKALSLRECNKDGIHVVPGNHDVDRALCTSRDSLNLKKFDPISAAWAAAFDDVIVTRGFRQSCVSDGPRQLKLFSLNSCMGCGEWRMLPEEIRDELASAIEKLRTKDPKAAFRVEGQQLDTPMFAHDDIELLHQKINQLALDQIPVVLAHHNLLPQQMLRIELYTELINSGQFRTTLTNFGRPVIYCHGHIHNDPIETIGDSKKPGSQLICVSAPLLAAGFNELLFYFSRDNAPLGLEVVFHRMSENGNVGEAGRHRIPFANQKGFVSPDLENLKECLKKDRIRLLELKTSFEMQTSSKMNQPTFAELLKEAEWLGMIEIEHRTIKPEFWIIRRRWI